MARRKKLEKLFRRQNGKCIFCSCNAWLAPPGVNKRNKAGPGQRIRDMATIEHIHPQSLGGTDRMTNLAMACHGCNTNRGVLDFEYFKEVRSDPEKWHEHNKKRTKVLSQASEERKAKSEERRTRLIWNLAIFFHIHSRFG